MRLRLEGPPRAEDRASWPARAVSRRIRSAAAARKQVALVSWPQAGGANCRDRREQPRSPCRACTTCSTATSSRARPSADGGPRYAARAANASGGRVARYAGEWVAAVVADTRALAEDAAERVRAHLRAAALCAARRAAPTAGLTDQLMERGRARLRRAARPAPSCGARSTRISPTARASCRCA